MSINTGGPKPPAPEEDATAITSAPTPQPSKGDIVVYYDADATAGIAAIVTKVAYGGTLSLTLFPENEAPRFREGVPHIGENGSTGWGYRR